MSDVGFGKKIIHDLAHDIVAKNNDNDKLGFFGKIVSELCHHPVNL